mmetsp:Transcript_39639/g.112175  ORF Transcript_39639/g.112175 Transcript_39639/m.112175 type:complete len:219 (+) Transcript_39639:488-1144(+)
MAAHPEDGDVAGQRRPDPRLQRPPRQQGHHGVQRVQGQARALHGVHRGPVPRPQPPLRPPQADVPAELVQLLAAVPGALHRDVPAAGAAHHVRVVRQQAQREQQEPEPAGVRPGHTRLPGADADGRVVLALRAADPALEGGGGDTDPGRGLRLRRPHGGVGAERVPLPRHVRRRVQPARVREHAADQGRRKEAREPIRGRHRPLRRSGVRESCGSFLG